jgi:hypothetical protein
MHTVRIACCLMLAAGAAQAEETGNIDKLNFRGDAVKLELSADAAKPYKLNLEKRNWSDTRCKVNATRQGRELTFQIDLGAVAADRCGLVIKGNVKPGKQIDVDLKAFDGDLNGTFDAVQVHGQAIDVDLKGAYRLVKLNGRAIKGDVEGKVGELNAKGDALTLDFKGESRSLSLDGQAVKSDVELHGAQPAADVRVHGQMVKLAFSANRQAKLDYQVNGQAMTVNGDWANTPGAPLKLRVSGQAVQVSLEKD